MRMIITATTDRQFLGHDFDSEEYPILLDEHEFYYESKLPLLDGMRFISSSYIIDASEVA